MTRAGYIFSAFLVASILAAPSAYAFTADTNVPEKEIVVEKHDAVRVLEVPVEPSVNLHNIERHMKRPRGAYHRQVHNHHPEELLKNLDVLLEFDFFTKYVSKGLPSSEGPIWQPSLTLEAYNVGVSVWSNFVLDNEPNQGQFNEVDITPYYSLRIGKFNFIPSTNFLLFMNKNPQSLNYSSRNVIRPQWHMSYEFGNFIPYADGFYYVYPPHKFATYHDVGLLFHYDFSRSFSIDTSAQVAIAGHAWNKYRIGNVGTEANNFEYALSLNAKINDNFIVSPVIHVVVTLPESVRNDLTQPDFVWGGIMFKYDI